MPRKLPCPPRTSDVTIEGANSNPQAPLAGFMTTPAPLATSDLTGLRIAVIGSSTGIGRATAIRLAQRGADVIVHGRTRSEALLETAESVKQFGQRCEIVTADLADRAACDRLVDDVWNFWGGCDAWLQLAGADTLTGVGAKESFEAKLDRLLAVDVIATMRVCRAVGARMQEQGSGSIVTMGWDQAETGMEGDSGELFAATKGAIMAFTRSLALSLAPKVRVNAVAPGWIKTAWGDSAPTVWQDRVLRETPLKRWGLPEDVAEAAAYLVSPGASFISGQCIRVNGAAIR